MNHSGLLSGTGADHPVSTLLQEFSDVLQMKILHELPPIRYAVEGSIIFRSRLRLTPSATRSSHPFTEDTEVKQYNTSFAIDNGWISLACLLGLSQVPSRGLHPF